MTYLENLILMRDNVAAQLAALSGSTPGVIPDYSVGGQSVQETAHFVALSNQLAELTKRIAQAQPFAVRSRGRI